MEPKEHVKRLRTLIREVINELNTIRFEDHLENGGAVWSAVNNIELSIHELEIAFEDQDFMKG